MRRSVLILFALLMTIYCVGMWGCSKEIEGPPRVNQPPQVQFVNIPVEGTNFSADTTIFWYGTDVDGFIRYYYYAVVESTLVADLAGGDVVSFAANNPDTIDWTELEVLIDNPQTSARINLKADSLDPVRSFISSYVILKAVDNKGAESDVVWRMFRKNNHFPETLIDFVDYYDPFINANDDDGVLEGVELSWGAQDPIDYPRNPPPFQYRWKMIGPFEKDDYDSLRHYLQVEVFVDPNGDTYLGGDSLELLDYVDTTINDLVVPPETTFTPVYEYVLVDTLGASHAALGKWRNYFVGSFLSVDSSILSDDSLMALDAWRSMLDPNVNSGIIADESSGWTYDEETRLYSLFDNQDITPGSADDTTRIGYFVFACQARDDSDVPDRVPDYALVQAIEPRFERELLVIDQTDYNWRYPLVNVPYFPPRPNPVAPSSEPNRYAVRNVYGQFANNWKPGCYDTVNILDEVYGGGTRLGYSDNGCTQDYISTQYLTGPHPDSLEMEKVPLKTVLKHKVVLIIKDSPVSIISLNNDIARNLFKGLNSGMSVWTMARGPFEDRVVAGVDYDYATSLESIYSIYFAVDSMFRSGWQGIVGDYWIDLALVGQNPPQPPTYPYRDQIYRVEDFIGAIAVTNNVAGVPDIFLDTALLTSRYAYYEFPGIPYSVWPYIDSIPAMPAIGSIEPVLTTGVHSLFRYKSRYYARVENGQIVEEFDPPRKPWYIDEWSRDYNGKICAMAYETQVFKTSHFCFPLMAMDEASAQQVFNGMMDWLTVQPYIQTGNFSTSGTADRVSVSKLRSVEDYYDELYRNGLLDDQSSSAR